MLYESLQELGLSDDPTTRPAPVAGMLPARLVWCQRAAGLLRDALRERGIGDWKIYFAHNGNLDLEDLDDVLPAPGKRLAWRPLPGAIAGGEDAAQLVERDDRTTAARHAGWILLRKHRVALARWFWLGDRGPARLWLCAAPSPAHFRRLHRRVERLRRERAASVWQIVSGGSWNDEPPKPREPVAEDDLLLTDALRERVVADVVRFFGSEVAELYRALGVPYRRGVLLHGPPGNGKTSLIRYVGAALPRIPAMILRPGASFDSDDMLETLRRWRQQAPAILVIEDLDWLLNEKVNVSTFLNQIDGIDHETTGGLLLIATTNHPDRLDPAVNNRPGRFDVVIEVPPPDVAMRRRFFARRLRDVSSSTIEALVMWTEHLSFSHLQEILRLSGLLVIRADRGSRTDEDVLRAAELVQQGHDDALRGFPPRSGLEFGLQHVRKLRQNPIAEDPDA